MKYVCSIILIFIILCFFLLDFADLGSSTSNSKSKTPIRATGVKGTFTASTPVASGGANQDSRIIRPSTDALDAYISSAPDKLGATLGAFFVSYDEKYFNLLETWPDSKVALAVLALSENNPAKALTWANQLEKDDPSNPLAPLLKIKSLLRGSHLDKKPVDIGELLKQVTQKTKFTLPSEEIIGYTNAVFTGTGHSMEQAIAFTHQNSISNSLRSGIEGSINVIWAEQLKNANGDIDALVTSASDQMKLVSMYRNTGNDSTDKFITSQRMEEQVLKALPQDAEFGREGYTVADRLNTLKEENLALGKTTVEFGFHYKQAPKQILDQYESMRFVSGEFIARDWLIRVQKGNAQ